MCVCVWWCVCVCVLVMMCVCVCVCVCVCKREWKSESERVKEWGIREWVRVFVCMCVCKTVNASYCLSQTIWKIILRILYYPAEAKNVLPIQHNTNGTLHKESNKNRPYFISMLPHKLCFFIWLCATLCFLNNMAHGNKERLGHMQGYASTAERDTGYVLHFSVLLSVCLSVCLSSCLSISLGILLYIPLSLCVSFLATLQLNGILFIWTAIQCVSHYLPDPVRRCRLCVNRVHTHEDAGGFSLYTDFPSNNPHSTLL